LRFSIWNTDADHSRRCWKKRMRWPASYSSPYSGSFDVGQLRVDAITFVADTIDHLHRIAESTEREVLIDTVLLVRAHVRDMLQRRDDVVQRMRFDELRRERIDGERLIAERHLDAPDRRHCRHCFHGDVLTEGSDIQQRFNRAAAGRER
jgi:hypothetical protein